MTKREDRQELVAFEKAPRNRLIVPVLLPYFTLPKIKSRYGTIHKMTFSVTIN
jgi:hypothetical protein